MKAVQEKYGVAPLESSIKRNVGKVVQTNLHLGLGGDGDPRHSALVLRVIPEHSKSMGRGETSIGPSLHSK